MIGNLVLSIFNALNRKPPSGEPLVTVPSVNLTRYLGRWYEIARVPNPEQDGAGRRCVDVTATYKLRADGSVDVFNQARDAAAGMKARSIRGQARVLDDTGAKLRVTFFRLFGGPYWVIGLDPDYRWAVVGTPSRRRLWILARTPSLPAQDYDRTIQIAAANGYDSASIRPTQQSAAA